MSRAIAGIVGAQVAVTVLAYLAAGAWSGPVAASSAALGGAIGFLPSAAYALRLWWARGEPPARLLRAHYHAEGLKVGLTLALFAATFWIFKEVWVAPLFATYGLTLAVYWGALFVETGNHKK